MKTVALEDIVASTILTFCENAAELGCPRDRDVDMWFRELSEEDMFKVGDKLLRIQERDMSMNEEEIEEEEMEEDEMEEEELEDIPEDSDEYIAIDDDMVENVLAFARSRVVNDRQTLLNYGVNEALRDIIASDGANLEV
jgi:hypothetical protein